MGEIWGMSEYWTCDASHILSIARYSIQDFVDVMLLCYILDVMPLSAIVYRARLTPNLIKKLEWNELTDFTAKCQKKYKLTESEGCQWALFVYFCKVLVSK